MTLLLHGKKHLTKDSRGLEGRSHKSSLTQYAHTRKYIGKDSEANSYEALIYAYPRKIFTSVSMLPSEAKPMYRGDTNGRVSITSEYRGKSWKSSMWTVPLKVMSS